ncbi:MAG: hypothetical protein L3K26_09325, partial [Candidatus Hydrogenedentes bacterium]|nr:hypothetical protein [Candidatus Hydrogenedentota bacterium]
MIRILAALLFCVSATAEPLIVMDMNACLKRCGDDTVLRYDTLKLVASLQGVVNRDQPRLVLRFLRGAGQSGTINLDDYWLDTLRKGWLKDHSITSIDSLSALFAQFPDALTGAVVWDPKVLATANVAATICGVEGWLPVRANSTL